MINWVALKRVQRIFWISALRSCLEPVQLPPLRPHNPLKWEEVKQREKKRKEETL